jgi:hypothetical protein
VPQSNGTPTRATSRRLASAMCGRRINVGTPAKRGNSRALSGAGRGSERFLVWNLQVDTFFMMRQNELAAVAGFKPRFKKHDAASVDIMRWVWVATREYFSRRVSMVHFRNVFLAKISSVRPQPELRPSVLCSPRSPNKPRERTGKCRQFNGFGLVQTGSGPGGRWFNSTRPDHF